MATKAAEGKKQSADVSGRVHDLFSRHEALAGRRFQNLYEYKIDQVYDFLRVAATTDSQGILELEKIRTQIMSLSLPTENYPDIGDQYGPLKRLHATALHEDAVRDKENLWPYMPRQHVYRAYNIFYQEPSDNSGSTGTSAGCPGGTTPAGNQAGSSDLGPVAGASTAADRASSASSSGPGAPKQSGNPTANKADNPCAKQLTTEAAFRARQEEEAERQEQAIAAAKFDIGKEYVHCPSGPKSNVAGDAADHREECTVPYWDVYNLLGLFLSRLGPAPANADRLYYFLPLTIIYAKWCTVIAGHLAIGTVQLADGTQAPAPGMGLYPTVYQCTWISDPVETSDLQNFSLGASTAGSVGINEHPRLYPGVNAKRFKGTDVRLKTEATMKTGPWPAVVKIHRYRLLQGPANLEVAREDRGPFLFTESLNITRQSTRPQAASGKQKAADRRMERGSGSGQNTTAQTKEQETGQEKIVPGAGVTFGNCGETYPFLALLRNKDKGDKKPSGLALNDGFHGSMYRKAGTGNEHATREFQFIPKQIKHYLMNPCVNCKELLQRFGYTKPTDEQRFAKNEGFARDPPQDDTKNAPRASTSRAEGQHHEDGIRNQRRKQRPGQQPATQNQRQTERQGRQQPASQNQGQTQRKAQQLPPQNQSPRRRKAQDPRG